MKRWANLAGSVFAVAIMGAVLYLFGRDLRQVDFSNPALLTAAAGSVILYVLVVLTGALNWRILLTAFGMSPLAWSAERQLLLSQIGKYLPGNVAQYVGRAAMTLQSGVPARIVGLAIVTETAVILAGGFVSVALSIALFPNLLVGLQEIVPNTSAVIWLGAGLVIFFVLLLASTFASAHLKRLAHLPKIKLGGLVLAIALSTGSFLVLGWSLHLLVTELSPNPVPLSLSVTVFAAAWIAGLVTPGAPGGLGVREAVLTLGLAPFLGGPIALAAALLYRGVSVAGDVLAFGVGWLLPRDRRDLSNS